MDLDELKERTRSVKAPAFASATDPAGSVDDLISRMRASDTQDTQMVRRWRTALAVGGVAYTLLFTLTWIFPPDVDPGYHRLILALFALVLLLLGGRFHHMLRTLSGFQYSTGTLSFLEEAAGRYRFMRPKDLAFSLPYAVAVLALSGVAWVNGMHRYMPSWSDSTSILVFLGIMCVAGAIGLLAARRDWHRRKEPILRELNRLKEELTSPGAE